MAHTLEPATSGRAKCRGCERPISKGELRFGERLPNPFAEGEMTLWFHPTCAAYKRPEPLLELLAASGGESDPQGKLAAAAEWSGSFRRLPRIDGAERAPTGQARCRSCREPIAKGSWRVRLVFFEDGRFTKGGFVHLACRRAYFETDDIKDSVLHFSPDLEETERTELARELSS